MPRELQALLATIAVLVVAWIGYGLLFGEDATGRLTLETVSGTVRRVDERGEAELAEQGGVLRPRERIVAEAGGRAVIGLGPDSRLTVEENSTVQVLRIDGKGVQLELEGGRVHATVRPGSRRLDIGANGRGVSAEDAEFDVVRGEDGSVGVQSDRGTLELRGFGDVDRMTSGDRLVAAVGGNSQLTPASEELLLAVAWPEGSRTRAATVEVRGRTAPRAQLRASGQAGVVEGRADANGHFTLVVALGEGENVVSVEATSLLGEAVAVTSTYVRDTKAPSVGVEIRY